MGPGHGQWRRQSGFSLGEMLTVVIIGSMILVAILTVYNRANQAADAVIRKIDSPAWAREVLQLIAEDLGRALSADDVTLQIRNGADKGFQRAELVLRRTYHDSENKEQTLEEITWRAGYDYEGTTPGLALSQLPGGRPGRQALRRQSGGLGEKLPLCTDLSRPDLLPDSGLQRGRSPGPVAGVAATARRQDHALVCDAGRGGARSLRGR